MPILVIFKAKQQQKIKHELLSKFNSIKLLSEKNKLVLKGKPQLLTGSK